MTAYMTERRTVKGGWILIKDPDAIIQHGDHFSQSISAAMDEMKQVPDRWIGWKPSQMSVRYWIYRFSTDSA